MVETAAPEGYVLPVGEPVTLWPKKPVREGYDFLGWLERPHDQRADALFAPGTTFTPLADSTFAAQWKPATTLPPEPGPTPGTKPVPDPEPSEPLAATGAGGSVSLAVSGAVMLALGAGARAYSRRLRD